MIERRVGESYPLEEFEIVEIKEGETEGIEPGKYVVSNITPEELDAHPMRIDVLASTVALKLDRGVFLEPTHLRWDNKTLVFKLTDLERNRS